MLRTLLIATALLTTSGVALARDGHGRVITVEPHFSISFGTRHHDGFRVLYESGGHHYWTHTTYRPTQYIVLPPPQPVYYGYPEGHGHKKHHWKGHREDWDDDHGKHRGYYRESRHHDRHDRHDRD
ncbi:MAG: hypothetical protein ACLGHA_09620 [Gammaproteobacteria bacterium]